MDPVLDIRNLSLDFLTPRGTVHALRNVSLTVPEKKIVGIVGESGSGKSTILWSIMGLLAGNARITGGEIMFGDHDLLNLSEEELRAVRGEQISVVFQDPMTSQIPVLTYEQQMRDILYRRTAMNTGQKRDKALEMFGQVGIPDPGARVDQYPHHFSGGMRQRAGIAMALMTGPNLLLADEPTTALDVTMEAQIIHLLQELQSQTGGTVVIVSHNLGLIAELCDEVVVMYAGAIVEAGDVRQIFYEPRHPYTRALLECDPARVAVSNGKLPVIAGDIPDLVRPPQGCVFAARCPKVMPICEQTPPSEVDNGSGGRARCHLLAGPGHDATWPPPADEPVLTVPDQELSGEPKSIAAEPVLDVNTLNVRFRTMGPWKARWERVDDPFVDGVLDVSIDVRPGETVGLVGESGSGKTTLGRTIINLIEAASGEVTFDGRNIRNMAEAEFKPLRRDMAMMFQDPIGSLSPRKSVRALITEPFQIHGVSDVDLDLEAERLADLVRLPKAFLSRYPHQLSGGQARRVGVARALALNPRLIIADEPTAGLDVSVQGEILNLMADLQREHGLAYLIITHNLPVIRHISDRLAIMYLGRIVEVGDAAQVFSAPAHPYTQALVNGIPQPDPDRRRTHVSISGEVPSLLNRPKGCDFVTRCPHAFDRCRTEKPTHETRPDGRIFACHAPLT